MEKLRRIERIGLIPFNNFREKNRIVNKLRTEIGRQVRITVESNFVFYQYFELQ